mgnify:CR=1 FL=1
MDYNYKKSDRSSRNEKVKSKDNKYYGSKKHMDGIKQYGITEWHRTTFGICKQYTIK